MSDYSDILAKRIEEFRKKRNDLSVNALADMAGVPQSTLNSILHGESENPKIQTLHKIALAFGLTISEFLDYEEMNMYSFEKDEDI